MEYCDYLCFQSTIMLSASQYKMYSINICPQSLEKKDDIFPDDGEFKMMSVAANDSGSIIVSIAATSLKRMLVVVYCLK